MNTIQVKKALQKGVEQAKQDLQRWEESVAAFEKIERTFSNTPAKKTPRKPAKPAKRKPAAYRTARNTKIKTTTPRQHTRKPAPSTALTQASKGKGGRKPRQETVELVDAIRGTLGSQSMNCKEVFDALKAGGRKINSNDPSGFIRYLLSTNKAFTQDASKGRGYYKTSTPGVVPAQASTASTAKPTARKKLSNGLNHPTVGAANPFS